MKIYSTIYICLLCFLASCQFNSQSGSPVASSNLGSLYFKDGDSIQFISKNGNSTTSICPKALRTSSFTLVDSLIYYLDNKSIVSLNTSFQKVDTLIELPDVIVAENIIVKDSLLVIFNFENSYLININSRAIVKKMLGNFSNFFLTDSKIYYSTIVENTKSELFKLDLKTDKTLSLGKINDLVFAYQNSYELNWNGIISTKDYLFVHANKKVYVINLKNNSLFLTFYTNFEGGLTFKGSNNDKVYFREINGETIEVNLKTQKIKRTR